MTQQNTQRVVKETVKLLRKYEDRLQGIKSSLLAHGLVEELHTQGWEFKITPWGIPGLDRQVELWVDRNYPEIVVEEVECESLSVFHKEHISLSDMERRAIERSGIKPMHFRNAIAWASQQPGNAWLFTGKQLLRIAKDLSENGTKCKTGHTNKGDGTCYRCGAKMF